MRKKSLKLFGSCIVASLLLVSGLAAAQFYRGSLNSGGGNFSQRIRSVQLGSVGLRSMHLSLPAAPALAPAPVPAPAKAPGIDDSFQLSEVYAFPNPAKLNQKPTIHVECGVADTVVLHFYDISGQLLHSAELAGPPQIIDDGQGPQYAYEYLWNDDIPSGTYLCAVQARKQNADTLRRLVRLAVIR